MIRRFAAVLAAMVLLIFAPAASGDEPTVWQPPAVIFDPVLVTAPPRLPPVVPQPEPIVVPVAPSVAPERLNGVASWYASWCNCTAMRQWRGKLVEVVGPSGSQTVQINDYGPAKWTGRIIDLNPTTFQAVCGDLGKGTCQVQVTLVH